MSSSAAQANQYKKLSHREHILELPDTYVGSCETHDEWRWIYESSSGKMTHKQLKFNPGFYKLFDELIVNARDARIRSLTTPGATPVKHIDICVSSGDVLKISVENDGDGIPIALHEEHKCWVPELIFGHLLTSGNYDKGEEKIVGGKNGYGAKLVNVFSNTFTVDVRHPASGQKYQQVWSDHMSKCGKASIRVDKAKTGCVKITYEPDLSRFHNIDVSAMIEVLHTRTVELAALCGKEVKVTYNGEAIGANTFDKFVKLFVKDGASVVYENCGPRWEVACILTRSLFEEDSTSSDEGARAISFVNGINTKKGGKHVETVVRHVLTDFCEAATKKKVPVKPAQIRDAVVFFVNATIVNPSFESQTKETLTTAANKFGSIFKTEGALVTGLMKAGLLEEAQAALEAKSAKDAKKTDGAKKKTLRGYPKLEDALWAGTANSEECTLILTEGDSAATSAISGLKVVGREKFGVFPLRGKLLNVKDISQEAFNKNQELTAIKAILGLRQGKVYADKKELRYGRVMVMADQDHDGSHIKGLLMNLFHTEWPGLMKMGFLCSLATPLLKATKGKQKLSFYSIGEFDTWKESNNNGSGWSVKYYKGLGTSTPEEAREWFQKLTEIHYEWDDNSDESISLAFHKKRSDDRKEWLAGYDPKRLLNAGAGGQIPYSRFIHDELIHFSNADNLRSLPHIMDGLKPSQRKILFGCFKRGLRAEVKVAQLAGYVSEHAAYHHGEASLCGTIVGMAQTFVGANNINLLVPNGQFGSRLLGGKDSASPRYIFTCLEQITDKIFRKEDANILKHLEDDGLIVEPEHYLPTIPLLLVNGCVGIGTGFSTNIPPYNPSDIIHVLREKLLRRLPSLKMVPMKPWWQGFKGTVVSDGSSSWVTKGVYTLDDKKNTITITELPIGVWTKDYKAYLDEIASAEKLKDGEKIPRGMDAAYTDDGKPVLKGFDDLYTDDVVKFILYFDEDTYEDMKAHPADFEKRFQLMSTWHTSNMVAFDNNMKITKYSSPGQILEAYFEPRLASYEARRAAEMERLEAEAIECDAKARFIKAVLEGSLELRRASDEKIIEMMKEHDLPALSGSEEEKGVDAWEYLLRLRMDRVKASAVEEAEEKVAAAMNSLEELKGTSASQLWLKDLDELEAAWNKMMSVRIAEAADGKASSAPPAKKTRAKKA
jgi:DNA topoisomerase-2